MAVAVVRMPSAASIRMALKPSGTLGTLGKVFSPSSATMRRPSATMPSASRATTWAWSSMSGPMMSRISRRTSKGARPEAARIEGLVVTPSTG